MCGNCLNRGFARMTRQCYVRNDHLGLGIPYEHDGTSHLYEPDFIVRLTNGTHVILEIKGFEPDRVHAKHAAAKRWISAVNNWGKLKKWDFLVCRDPQLLGQELKLLEHRLPIAKIDLT